MCAFLGVLRNRGECCCGLVAVSPVLGCLGVMKG